jgi:hypothetical protein
LWRGYRSGLGDRVSPLLVEQVLGGFQYSVVAIVPDRDGKDFTPSYN